jgi:hypothetical protein
MYPFVFADAPNETGSGPMGKRVLASLGDLRVRRPSKWPHSQSRPEERWAASRLERRSEKPPTPALRLWSVFEAAPAALRTRPPVEGPGRERVAQKRTQVVETIRARKLVRGAETGKRS